MVPPHQSCPPLAVKQRTEVRGYLWNGLGFTMGLGAGGKR